MWTKKIECVQNFSSMLSTSVGVECGVLSVEYDSAVSGEPPLKFDSVQSWFKFRKSHDTVYCHLTE